MAHPSSDVAVHLDVKSPSGSGLRAVLSDPLDEYMDFDTLWHGLIHCSQYPRDKSLISSELTIVSKQSFVVSQRRRGQEGKESTIVFKHRHDKTRAQIETEGWGLNGQPLFRVFQLVWRQPLRVESWSEGFGRAPADLKSRAMTGPAQAMKAAILNLKGEGASVPVVEIGEVGPCSFIPGAGSVSLTPAGCEGIVFERFVEAYVAVLQRPQPNAFLKSADLTIHAETEEGSIFSVQQCRAGQAGDTHVHVNYTFNRCRNLVSSEPCVEGKVLWRGEVKLLRSPLRAEFTCWEPGERHPGQLLGMPIKVQLDMLVDEGRCRDEGLLPQPCATVVVRSGVDSPSRPGCKSVVSDSLAPLDFDSFWDQYLHVALGDAFPDPARVTSEVRLASPSGFLQLRTLRQPDGKQLHASANCWTDRAEGRVLEQNQDATGRTQSWHCLLIHRDPVRVEVWAEAPGARLPASSLQEVLAALVRAAVGRLAPDGPQAGEAAEAVQAVSPPGHEHARSGPLSALGSFSELWRECTAALQHGAWLEALGEGCVRGSEVLARTPGGCTVRHALSGANARGADAVRVKYWLSEVKGETVAETEQLRLHTLLLREPLRLLAWAERVGERSADTDLRDLVQSVVDSIVHKVYPP